MKPSVAKVAMFPVFLIQGSQFKISSVNCPQFLSSKSSFGAHRIFILIKSIVLLLLNISFLTVEKFNCSGFFQINF